MRGLPASGPYQIGSQPPSFPGEPPRQATAIGRTVGRGLRTSSLLVGLFLAWEFGVKWLNVPAYLVPAPTRVLARLIDGFTIGSFRHHTLVTVEEILVGYAVGATLGIGLGILISQYRMIDELLYPYVVAMNSLPKVAIAPLLIVWFGPTFQSKIIITALVSFFPLLVNVTVGLKSVDPEQIELMRALTASRWQIFSKVLLRNALPSIFAGLEIAIVLSVVGAIVAEFVGSGEGIGYFIQLSTNLVDTASMFAMFTILAVISFLLNRAVRFTARKVVFWQRSELIVESA